MYFKTKQSVTFTLGLLDGAQAAAATSAKLDDVPGGLSTAGKFPVLKAHFAVCSKVLP